MFGEEISDGILDYRKEWRTENVVNMWLKLHEQGTHAMESLKNISLLMGLEAKKVCVLKRVIINL